MAVRERHVLVPSPPGCKSGASRWLALTVLCVFVLIVNLDNTVLNVALPTLVRDRHTNKRHKGTRNVRILKSCRVAPGTCRASGGLPRFRRSGRMNEDARGFGAQLRACRQLGGLSQEELAGRSGLTPLRAAASSQPLVGCSSRDGWPSLPVATAVASSARDRMPSLR